MEGCHGIRNSLKFTYPAPSPFFTPFPLTGALLRYQNLVDPIWDVLLIEVRYGGSKYVSVVAEYAGYAHISHTATRPVSMAQ